MNRLLRCETCHCWVMDEDVTPSPVGHDQHVKTNFSDGKPIDIICPGPVREVVCPSGKPWEWKYPGEAAMANLGRLSLMMRLEFDKARMRVVDSAKRLVQLTRQNDPEGEFEFLQELIESVDQLKLLESRYGDPKTPK